MNSYKFLFTLLVMILISTCFLFTPSFAKQTKLYQLDIKGGRLSANLNDTPLEKVLEKLSQETQIKFYAKEFLLKNKIKSKFENFPIETGIKKILIHYDHAMVFNRDGKLIEVHIVGLLNQEKAAQSDDLVKTIMSGKKKAGIDATEFRIERNVSPPGADNNPGEPIKFEPRKKVPPPGASQTGDKTIGKEENVPPPGAESGEVKKLKFIPKKAETPPGD